MPSFRKPHASHVPPRPETVPSSASYGLTVYHVHPAATKSEVEIAFGDFGPCKLRLEEIKQDKKGKSRVPKRGVWMAIVSYAAKAHRDKAQSACIAGTLLIRKKPVYTSLQEEQVSSVTETKRMPASMVQEKRETTRESKEEKKDNGTDEGGVLKSKTSDHVWESLSVEERVRAQHLLRYLQGERGFSPKVFQWLLHQEHVDRILKWTAPRSSVSETISDLSEAEESSRSSSPVGSRLRRDSHVSTTSTATTLSDMDDRDQPSVATSSVDVESLATRFLSSPDSKHFSLFSSSLPIK